MASVVRGVAKVVGTVASIAAMIPGPHQPFAAAIAVTAQLATQLTAKKPRSPGTSTDYRFDPNAGIPYAFGRCLVAGNVVHVDAYGKDNRYQSFVLVWSGGGPVDGIETVLVDRAPVSFSGGAAVGYYNDYMWLQTQLGATPQAAALAAPFAGFPGWGAASKLSGYAAGIWTLKISKQGKRYAAGLPEFGVVGRWARVYDPRLDSTFPGGSGSCRAGQESTYVWSRNGALHALTFALGRFQNSKKVLGVGLPVDDIDVAAFVEAANVADANGWTCDGVAYSTDDKWNVLKLMLATCAAEPKRLGAKLSCLVRAPRVSLATLTGADLAEGELQVPSTQRRRERINTVIPRYLSEAHGWQIIPAAEVSVPAYVTEDGGKRSRESEMPYVSQLDQAAELAAYEIVEAREFGPIVLPLKTRAIGYAPGDALTLDIPELGLNGLKALVIKRALDPLTGAVMLTFKSETDAKHDFALGRTGVAPPTPSLGLPVLAVDAPAAGSWAAAGATFVKDDIKVPAIVVTGAADNGVAEDVIFEFRPVGAPGWTHVLTADADATRCEITGLTPETDYDVAVSYRLRGVVGPRLVLPGVLSGEFGGVAGPVGKDGYAFELSTYTVTILCNPFGVPKTGQLPRQITAALGRGGESVTGATSFSLPGSGGVTAGISGNVATITAIEGDGFVTIRAQHEGFDHSIRVPIQRQLDAAPPNAGLTLQTTNTMGAAGASASYGVTPPYILTVTANGAGQVRGIFGASYSVPVPETLGTNSLTLAGKIGYRLAGSGGPWVDLAAQAFGSSAIGRRFEIAPGEQEIESSDGSVGQDVTVGGLTAGAAYEFGWFARRSNGTYAVNVPISGSFTVRHP